MCIHVRAYVRVPFLFVLAECFLKSKLDMHLYVNVCVPVKVSASLSVFRKQPAVC